MPKTSIFNLLRAYFHTGSYSFFYFGMTRQWASKLDLLTAAAVLPAPPVALITNGNTSNGWQEHVIYANAEKISSNIIIKALGMVYALCMCNFFFN